jgi:predicted acetylornithine/succinylornithine family transaminase
VTPSSPAATESLAARAARVLMGNYGERTLAIVEGRGARCRDESGREYLDFLGGIAVNNLGHCHPAVVEAVRRQAGRLIHCSNAFLIEPQVELAEALAAQTGLSRFFFCNSGAEATEAAIKLARLWGLKTKGPGHATVLVFEGSFHGRTYGSMSATWSPKVREGFDPLVPGFTFAKLNDLASVDAAWDDSVCGVLVETVQGEGGVTPCSAEFIRGLRERCDARGALLVLDEVQCGFGRSGRAFAYEHSGVAPDVVPMAKAIAGGLPLGALGVTEPLADVLHKGSHGSTFGGNPVACAAGLAVARVIFDEAFLATVRERACEWWGILESLKADFPDDIREVRGLGLMQGLVLNRSGADCVGIGREHGLLFNCTADTVLRFLPPLIVTPDDLAEAGDKLRRTLSQFLSRT